jgi:hypothetical protein
MSCAYGAYMVYGWQAEDDDDDNVIFLEVDGRRLVGIEPQDLTVPLDIETMELWQDGLVAIWQSGIRAEFWVGAGFRVGDHTGRPITFNEMATAVEATTRYAAAHLIDTTPSWWLILTNEEAW